jgi:valyl-tRNA synthetase
LEGEAGRIEAKLANADFTDRAPEDVVRRARTQLATARTDLKALQAKQKALG